MRGLFIICIISSLALTGCKFHPAIYSGMPQINETDLARHHVYKIPAKDKNKHCLRYFNDAQLQRLITIALNDAPDIRSAQARVLRSQQIAKGSYAALWPSADLQGALADYQFALHGVVPQPFNELAMNKANIAEIALNFNYEIDFWGKNRETFVSKLDEAFAAQMELEETRLILSANVASTYFELQNVIQQQQLAATYARIAKELEAIVMDRAKQGIESDIPVKTAITNTQAAQLSLQNYQRAQMQTRNQLAILLGKNPFNTQVETPPFTYNTKQLNLPPVVPANLLAQRPDIIAARSLTESAAHQIKVARAAFFPNVNLSALLNSLSFYSNPLFNISLQNAGVRGALDLPVFDAGARRANLGVKQADFDYAISQYNQTILNALHEVTDQIAALRTLNQQVKEQDKAVNSTAANYKLFRARYTQGIIDYVQLLEIKQSLLQQKSTLLSLQTRHKQAFVALLAALGGEVRT